MSIKGILTALAVLSITSSTFANRPARLPTDIAAKLSTIESLLAKSNAGVRFEGNLPEVLQSALRSGRISETELSTAFKSIADTLGDMPKNLNRTEVETLLANRINAILLNAGSDEKSDITLTEGVTLKKVLEVLSNGKNLANLAGWAAQNLSGLNKLLGYFSANIQLAGTRAALNRDGRVSEAAVAQALEDAVKQYLKESNSNLTYEQFLIALVNNCA